MAAILLIDDMKGVRRTVSALLTRAGHTVTEADDGGAGLDLLRGGQRFDLVITDMLMPKHDGGCRSTAQGQRVTAPTGPSAVSRASAQEPPRPALGKSVS
jgi:CheY-like chemotaxis protein